LEFSKSLKENYEFRRIYSRGKSAVSPYMVLYCRKNGRDYNRFGITASTKLGHAVVRNRIRRRFREIYRTNEGKFSRGWDIIVVARFRCVDGKYSVMQSEFLRLAEKLGITK
jgi:ribonuclease P protein component